MNIKRGLLRVWFAFSVLWSIGTALLLAWDWFIWVVPSSGRAAPSDYFTIPPVVLAPWIVTIVVIGVLWIRDGFRSN
jgi:hypothetical protein